jgi:hypothetical protein
MLSPDLATGTAALEPANSASATTVLAVKPSLIIAFLRWFMVQQDAMRGFGRPQRPVAALRAFCSRPFCDRSYHSQSMPLVRCRCDRFWCLRVNAIAAPLT